MSVCLIKVPYTIGNERHGASAGAQRLADAAPPGLAASVECVERPGPFTDSTSSSVAVNKQLAKIVRRATDDRQLPIVLAGSCDACLGALGGFDHRSCGVVWFDAHGDFNTPDSTVSGFFPGMSLAIVTGHCYAGLWSQIGDNSPVPESSTLLLGVRDLSPAAERERLERSAVTVVPWRDGGPEGDVHAAVDALAQRVGEVYLHVDLDALDPGVATGIVDAPVAGGLSLRDLEEAIDLVTSRLRVRVAAVTTFNPELDQDDRTLRAALGVVELLAAVGATDHSGRRG